MHSSVRMGVPPFSGTCIGSDHWSFQHRDSRDGPLRADRHAASYTTPQDANKPGPGADPVSTVRWVKDVTSDVETLAAVFGEKDQCAALAERGRGGHDLALTVVAQPVVDECVRRPGGHE